MPSARRSIDVDVPMAALMELLCDFERYPEFVSSVLQAQVVESEVDRWRVAFELLLFRRRVGYTLELARESADRLSWKLVEGDWMSENEGEWTLARLDDATTRATYVIRVTLRSAVPTGLTPLLIDASIPRMLREFKREGERRWRQRAD